jgi:hypothetical protein
MTQPLPKDFNKITKLALNNEEFRRIVASGDPKQVQLFLRHHGIRATKRQIEHLVRFDFDALQDLLKKFDGHGVLN